MWGGGGCTRVKWVPIVLLAFFLLFYSFFASKLAIFPLKRSVLGAWKGHFRARKGQMADLGFQDPKTTSNANKTRENVTTPQMASLHGLASNWAKNCYKTGEKNAKRTNGTYFARPRVHTWNGYHLSFWRFFPCFYIFCFKTGGGGGCIAFLGEVWREPRYRAHPKHTRKDRLEPKNEKQICSFGDNRNKPRNSDMAKPKDGKADKNRQTKTKGKLSKTTNQAQ